MTRLSHGNSGFLNPQSGQKSRGKAKSDLSPVPFFPSHARLPFTGEKTL